MNDKYIKFSELAQLTFDADLTFEELFSVCDIEPITVNKVTFWDRKAVLEALTLARRL